MNVPINRTPWNLPFVVGPARHPDLRRLTPSPCHWRQSGPWVVPSCKGRRVGSKLDNGPHVEYERMNWSVEYTNEFGGWWAELAEDEQEGVAAGVELLTEYGPGLPFPYSSGVVRAPAVVRCANFASKVPADLFASSMPSTRGDRRSCMYVSNLRTYVEAMGGRLNVVAEFPQGHVTITNFSDADEDE